MKNDIVAVAGWIVGIPHPKPVTILRTMTPVRGFAILLVVMAHAVIMMLAAENIRAPGTSLTPELWGIWQLASPVKSIVLELCACAVPIFLFLSGFYTIAAPQSWKAIWSSCRKLLLPMITWSLLAWAISWRKGAGWSIMKFLGLLLSGKTQTGYFFIVLIIQFYILSRWLVPAMKKHASRILFFAILLQLATHLYDYVYLLAQLGIIPQIWLIAKIGPFPEFLFPRFMVAFTLGVWASQANQPFRNIIQDQFPVVLFATTLAAAILVFERGLLFRHAFVVLERSEFEATAISWVGWKLGTALWTISAIFLVLGWFQKRIPIRSLLDKLGKYSFQIFLLHGMILDFVRSLVYKYLHAMKFYGLTGCLVLLTAGIAGPIILTAIIQKWMPARLRAFMLGS